MSEKKAPPLLRASGFLAELASDLVHEATRPKLALAMHLTALKLGWTNTKQTWTELEEAQEAAQQLKAERTT